MTADLITDVTSLRRSPLHGVGFGIDVPGLSLAEAPFRSLLEVRSSSLPTLPGQERDAYVWQLGPQWWLVDGATAAEAGLEVPLAGSVRSAQPSSKVVDVSAQRTTIVVGGEHALTVLAHGCSIDLSVVPPGGCVQGNLAGAQVAIGRCAGEVRRVYVRPAFARHLAAWLTDAASEYL